MENEKRLDGTRLKHIPELMELLYGDPCEPGRPPVDIAERWKIVLPRAKNTGTIMVASTVEDINKSVPFNASPLYKFFIPAYPEKNDGNKE